MTHSFWKRNFYKCTIGKGTFSYYFNSFWNSYIVQIFAFTEYPIANFSHAIRDFNCLQCCVCKSIIANFCYSFRNYNFTQKVTSVEDIASQFLYFSRKYDILKLYAFTKHLVRQYANAIPEANCNKILAPLKSTRIKLRFAQDYGISQGYILRKSICSNFRQARRKC